MIMDQARFPAAVALIRGILMHAHLSKLSSNKFVISEHDLSRLIHMLSRHLSFFSIFHIICQSFDCPLISPWNRRRQPYPQRVSRTAEPPPGNQVCQKVLSFFFQFLEKQSHRQATKSVKKFFFLCHCKNPEEFTTCFVLSRQEFCNM
jgi:hypothetical protein